MRLDHCNRDAACPNVAEAACQLVGEIDRPEAVSEQGRRAVADQLVDDDGGDRGGDQRVAASPERDADDSAIDREEGSAGRQRVAVLLKADGNRLAAPLDQEIAAHHRGDGAAAGAVRRFHRKAEVADAREALVAERDRRGVASVAGARNGQAGDGIGPEVGNRHPPPVAEQCIERARGGRSSEDDPAVGGNQDALRRNRGNRCGGLAALRGRRLRRRSLSVVASVGHDCGNRRTHAVDAVGKARKARWGRAIWMIGRGRLPSVAPVAGAKLRPMRPPAAAATPTAPIRIRLCRCLQAGVSGRDHSPNTSRCAFSISLA